MPPPAPPVHRFESVTDGQADRIRDLSSRAERVDGVAPLSEQFLLDLRPGSGAEHLLVESGTGVLGYAQLADPGMPSSAAELVVAPDSRRHGLGRALVAAMPRDVRIWAHGDPPGARAFAAALGLRTVRELHRMRLRFADVELEQPKLPPGFTVRGFRPGADDEAWVRVNAAAFADHPEQGRLTVADLHERMAQPWFDPRGFLLVVPVRSPEWPEDVVKRAEFPHLVATRRGEGAAGGEGVAGGEGASMPTRPAPALFSEWPEDVVKRAEFPHLVATRRGEGAAGQAGDAAGHADAGAARPIAAFHWTKAPPPEVYVLGVHPAYQGLGLGRPVTLLGLHHLRGLGYDEVTLYVDADNAAAMRTYRGLGFATVYVDRMVAFQAVPEGATIPA